MSPGVDPAKHQRRQSAKRYSSARKTKIAAKPSFPMHGLPGSTRSESLLEKRDIAILREIRKLSR